MSAERRKKIVFDFAGVLFRWRPATMLRLEVPHLAPDDETAARVARAVFQDYGGDWGEFDRGTVEVDDLVVRIAARTGHTEADVRRIVDAVPRELQPVPETVELLRRLRDAGREIYFVSNMPAPYVDHLRSSHDFIGWFADGVFSSTVKLIKPEAAMFELAARRFGADPADLVFLDDHPVNVDAARALGWHALHFSTAARAAADLADHGWA